MAARPMLPLLAGLLMLPTAGPALAAEPQLAAFREMFSIFGSAPTVWMTATGRPEWLDIPRRAVERLLR